MLLTKSEILDIFEEHIYADSVERVHGEDDAANAIAARLERLGLIIEMLAERGDDPHAVGECIKAARALMGREGATE